MSNGCKDKDARQHCRLPNYSEQKVKQGHIVNNNNTTKNIFYVN